MKPTTALLAASLVANAALLAFAVSRSTANRTARDAAPGSLATASPSSSTNNTADALRAALASGDAAALVAAGVPPETARELAAGRALLRAAERIRAARANQPADDRWWRTNRNQSSSRELSLQARRELSDALAAAGLSDLNPYSPTGSPELLDFLSPEKRDALRRITQDYDEMMAKFSAGGIQLPSDRERLKLLRAERDRDIAALLTPTEREAYELRTSPTSQSLRARYGDAIETEDDFKKLYALQKAFDEKFSLDPLAGRITPEQFRERADANRQLQDDIRAALGDDKYAALRRAADSDLRNVESLATRLNLPPDTTDRVAAARESLAAESQRINADPALTPQQRREQLQQLGARAKSELTQTLGAEAAEAYAQRSPWVSMLQNGMAFTTTPSTNAPGVFVGTGPSVHPVPPAGAPGPGGARQFTIATPMVATDVVTTDPLAGAAAGGVQVMTFGSSASTSETAPSGTAPAQRVLIAPKTDTPPPKR